MFKLNEKSVLYIFVVIFLLSVYIVYLSIDRHAELQANKRIDTILEQHKALHKYVESVQKLVIYQLKEEGKLDKEWFDPKILSFTYIARNIHQNYKDMKKNENEESYQYKLATNNPRNPVNMATPFESDILKRFNKKEFKEFHSIIEEKDKTYYYKALPLSPNKASCMRCHSTKDVAPKEMVEMYGDGGYAERIGDIRAMISLKVPITEIQKEAINQFFILSSLLAILLLVLYILIRRIIKQKRLLQEEIEKNKQKDALLAEQAKMVALGEMIGNIAHQWRQPLSMISTASTGVLMYKDMGKLNDDFLEKEMTRINDNAQYLSKTIDDFRDFMKDDTQKVSFNLNEELEKCLQIEEGVIKQNSLKVIKNIDKNIVMYGLPHGLSQALINIINNAKDAMLNLKSDKYLFIDTILDDKQIRIMLKDNGGGIPKDIIHKVFEPYFTTKHQSNGTGLGLHMTYQIITEHMKGSITVNNETYSYDGVEYTGACFTICLPLEG
jgi:signal transduction histidine kinase